MIHQNNFKYCLCLLLISTLLACQFSTKSSSILPTDTLPNRNTSDSVQAAKVEALAQQKANALPFDRTTIVDNLAKKRQDNTPLVVHIFVPLCDNKYQGIVPVPPAIGNGQDARNNLYWGAMYGVKSHFKRLTKWKLVQEQQNLNDYVLERVVFKASTPQNQVVYLVADAYNGKNMKQCLEDYYATLAGQKTASITISQATIPIYAHSDLLIFNGHNGLMDMDISIPQKINATQKDAVVIACVSGSFFQPAFLELGAYPLVTTTNLLAPEAYVLEGIIEAWMNPQQDTETIRMAAAKAYHQYQKCGLRGASRLFSTGW